MWLIFEQIHALGAQSISLVIASAAATGAVLAIQFSAGLQRFGGHLYVPQIVAVSLLREMGPVLVSLLLAGRIGSGITAELASMKVTEQVAAVRALGASPFTALVIPRILACLIAFPILGLIADFVGIVSAMLILYIESSMEPKFYLSKTLSSIHFHDLWTGLLKVLIFGFYVSSMACWKGLNTEGGTRGVGSSTTWIIVNCSIFILVADFILSKIFLLTVLSYD